MKTMAEVLAEHRPSRWRSFANENEILRCCRQDFGNVSKKPVRDDNAKTWEAFAAHQAEALAAAGFGDIQTAKVEALEAAVEAFPLETITAPDNAVVWLAARAGALRGA